MFQESVALHSDAGFNEGIFTMTGMRIAADRWLLVPSGLRWVGGWRLMKRRLRGPPCDLTTSPASKKHCFFLVAAFFDVQINLDRSIAALPTK